MKLQLKTYDYSHYHTKTYAERDDTVGIWGSLAIYPQTIKKTGAIIGNLSDITTLREGSIGTDPYIQIPQNGVIELGFNNADSYIGQIGEFSDSNPTTRAAIVIISSGESASSKYEVKFQHPVGLQYYVSAADHTPGTSVGTKSIGVTIGSGFSMKLFMESKITITNNSASAEWIRLYDVYFSITNTVKSGVQTKAVYGRFYGVFGTATRRGDRIPTEKTLLMSKSSKEVTGWDGDNIFATGFGRMFDRWIDSVSGSARSNGKNENGLINCPPYIIESLLRDENFAERDLKITAVTDTTHIIVNGLLSSEDDYYNYAIYYNVTTDHKTYVTDYAGSTKTLTLASADTSASASDNIFLQNVKGDEKIDYSTFDIVGNNTDGTRKGWKFARAYTEKQNIFDIINELCFDSHCEIIESVNPDTCEKLIKLVDLDSDYSDTWTNPAYGRDGLERIIAQLSPLDNVFTQFRLRYFYDYGKRDYLKEIYVDKNGYPSSATILSDTEKNLCKYAEQTYLVSRLLELTTRNIYDDATAERMLQKKIEWFSKQRLIINYDSPIVGNSDFIKYEKGDKVKINFSKGVPSGVNNNTNFIIDKKIIRPFTGGGFITWRLIEL